MLFLTIQLYTDSPFFCVFLSRFVLRYPFEVNGLNLRKCPKVIDGERKWIRNDNEIRKEIRYAGCFVIRSNVETNPFKAFGIYGNFRKFDFRKRLQ